MQLQTSVQRSASFDHTLSHLTFSPGAYKRIHEDGLFPTSLTSMNPGCRNGQCLHPSQKRIITLREYARSQGFPDSFVFMSHKGSSTPVSQLHTSLEQFLQHSITVVPPSRERSPSSPWNCPRKGVWKGYFG